MYEILITRPAEMDLKKAVRYISIELQNPSAAMSLVDEVEKTVNSLAEMPCRNPLVRDNALAENGFRIAIVKNYLIFYIVRENTRNVVVERILSSKRDWESLL